MATPNRLAQAVMLTFISEMPSSNLGSHTCNNQDFTIWGSVFFRLLDLLVFPPGSVCYVHVAQLLLTLPSAEAERTIELCCKHWKLSTGKHCWEINTYVPTGCVLMIVLSMWGIIFVGKGALECLCPSSSVEWFGVCGWWSMSECQNYNSRIIPCDIILFFSKSTWAIFGITAQLRFHVLDMTSCVLYKVTDVSEKHASSVFRIDQSKNGV
jgi:hypothetical protein